METGRGNQESGVEKDLKMIQAESKVKVADNICINNNHGLPSFLTSVSFASSTK